MNLVHLIVRQWGQRKARTALSILSVAIAAAAVLGIALAQATVRLGYQELLEATGGRPALEILSAAGGRFAAGDVPDVSDIPGVSVASPIVTRATMARANGRRFRAVMLGVPTDNAGLWKVLPLEAGQSPREPDEALLAADQAERMGIELGDRLIVLARRGPRSAKIVGLVKPAPLRELAAAASIVVPLTTLQQWFELEDQVDHVRVLLQSSQDRDRVESAIAARLPADFVVQMPVGQMELTGTILRSTELALQFAGALSMVMAGFIVLNTLRMNFGERRRDMAVLRVLGATSQQLIKLQLIEGVCLGLIGAILGLPLGILLGRGLSAVMQRLGGTSTAVPELPYGTLAAAIIVGPLVAGAAALIPAFQSRGVSANEALGNTEGRRLDRVPIWAIAGGTVMWSVAAVLQVLVIFERVSPRAAIPSGVLMLVGFIALIPVLLKPIIRVVARLIAPAAKMEGDFAVTQLLERPTRTGLTVGVLVVAISTCVGLGNAILTNVNDVHNWYRRTFAGDLVVTGTVADAGGERRDEVSVRDKIGAVEGIDAVISLRYLPARVNGVPAMCIVRDFPPQIELPWQVSPQEAGEIRAMLSTGDAVAGNILARRLEINSGDTARLEIQGRVLSVRVGDFVRDYTLGGLVVFLERSTAEKLVAVEPADMYVIQSSPDADIDKVALALEPIVRDEGLALQSYAQLRRRLDILINGIVGALWGLLVIGFVTGGFAMGNTLTISVLEQTRELGLLRVIGMTRQQTRKMIICESVLLGILGTMIGSAAGLSTAIVIHLTNEPLMGQSLPFALHLWLLGAVAVGSVCITLLAAWMPGERAARLDLLTAIAVE